MQMGTIPLEFYQMIGSNSKPDFRILRHRQERNKSQLHLPHCLIRQHRKEKWRITSLKIKRELSEQKFSGSRERNPPSPQSL